MARPKKHIFVCSHSRSAGHPSGCCADRGSQGVIMEFASELESRELFGELRITRTGCLGACDQGVAVVVYPDGVMYGGVSGADVREIVSEHVIEDRPVERLRVPPDVW